MNTKKIRSIKILITALVLTVITNIVFAQDVIIEANKQTHDGSKNVTTFEGNVRVRTEDITVKSPKALVNIGKDGKPENATFVQGAKAVQIKNGTQNEVKAQIIRLSLITEKVEAEGDAETKIIEKSKPEVTIKADKQSFNINTNLMQARGSVVINYGNLTTKSNSAKIKVDENGNLQKVKLIGDAEIKQDNTVVTGQNLIFNPNTNELTAIGTTHSKTILQDSTPVAIWADYQQFDKKANTLLSSGNVKITYKNYIATGPKATLLPSQRTKKPNKIVFVGRSKIQEGNKLVEADKIEVTMEPKNFNAEGNVRTKFTQVSGIKKKKK